MLRVRNGLRLAALTGLFGGVAILVPSVQTPSLAAASIRPCAASQLEVVVGTTSYGLGNWGTALLVVDPRGATCALEGYPAVRAYLSTTKRWVTPLRSPSGYMGGLGTGQKIQRIVLNSYRVASFMLGGTDNPVYPNTTCGTYVRVTVAFNGHPPSANLTFGLSACSRIQVHPVVYGPTGDQPLVE